jgi:hypothetical protein
MSRISTLVMLTTLTATLPVVAQTAAPGSQKASDSRDLPTVVALDARECRRLLAERGSVSLHQPAPDVTYQPGRDVDSQGRPIAPADLPGSGASSALLDQPVVLNLQIPLRRLLGDRTPANLGRSETNVGTIAVDPRTGKLALNGQPLEPQGEDALAQACREQLGRQPQRPQGQQNLLQPQGQQDLLQPRR